MLIEPHQIHVSFQGWLMGIKLYCHGIFAMDLAIVQSSQFSAFHLFSSLLLMGIQTSPKWTNALNKLVVINVFVIRTINTPLKS